MDRQEAERLVEEKIKEVMDDMYVELCVKGDMPATEVLDIIEDVWMKLTY